MVVSLLFRLYDVKYQSTEVITKTYFVFYLAERADFEETNHGK